MNRFFYCHRLISVGALAATIFMTGCLGSNTTAFKSEPMLTSNPGSSIVDVSSIPEPWRGPASKLARKGFSQSQLESVFKSPNLKYTTSPMSTKLNELYGIFYKSDVTRAIQENLYQLGYDLVIDGRNGPGTKKAITRFQQNNRLKVTGEPSESTLSATRKVMTKTKLRALASYKAPKQKPPSRTSTYPQFTDAKSLAQIKDYYNKDKKYFQAMSRQMNVPPELVASIMWIETRYGTYFGKQKAASQLASMAAAASDFQVIKPALTKLPSDKSSEAFLRENAVTRGNWALDELAALMKFSFDNGHDPTTFPGSIYGAVGWGQFMPSNIVKFGVDGDKDGKIDMFNKVDAIYSIGNYMKGHGWKGTGMRTMPEKERRAVILRYNKSGVYVNTVLYVADYLAK